jgi:hypothetical protein
LPIVIRLIHRIIVGISVSVRAHTGFVRVPPIRADELGDDGVVIAGVEIDKPCFGIVALSYEAFALRVQGGLVHAVAEGLIGRALGFRAIRRCDDFNRFQVVAMVEERLRRRAIAFSLDIRMDVLGPDARR